ncbi:MAG TPA: hypothetical protein VK575_09440 [Gemmatimonadaceae bacterium]|jgi:hypothetical protein|nr:hypothetical protein [Gemmatimonadaceae bacterium]
MTPIRYELTSSEGRVILRLYATGTLKGYTDISNVKLVTGKSIAGLQKTGQKLAKRNGVPFVDRT